MTEYPVDAQIADSLADRSFATVAELEARLCEAFATRENEFPVGFEAKDFLRTVYSAYRIERNEGGLVLTRAHVPVPA